MSDSVPAAGHSSDAQAVWNAENNVQEKKDALLAADDPRDMLRLSFELQEASNKKTIIVESISKVQKSEAEGQKSAIQGIV